MQVHLDICDHKYLLGYDFLNHLGLTLNCTNNRLIDTASNKQSNAKLTPEIMNIIVDQDNTTDMIIQKIIEKYPN